MILINQNPDPQSTINEKKVMVNLKRINLGENTPVTQDGHIGKFSVPQGHKYGKNTIIDVLSASYLCKKN